MWGNVNKAKKSTYNKIPARHKHIAKPALPRQPTYGMTTKKAPLKAVGWSFGRLASRLVGWWSEWLNLGWSGESVRLAHGSFRVHRRSSLRRWDASTRRKTCPWPERPIHNEEKCESTVTSLCLCSSLLVVYDLLPSCHGHWVHSPKILIGETGGCTGSWYTHNCSSMQRSSSAVLFGFMLTTTTEWDVSVIPFTLWSLSSTSFVVLTKVYHLRDSEWRETYQVIWIWMWYWRRSFLFTAFVSLVNCRDRTVWWINDDWLESPAYY